MSNRRGRRANEAEMGDLGGNAPPMGRPNNMGDGTEMQPMNPPPPSGRGRNQPGGLMGAIGMGGGDRGILDNNDIGDDGDIEGGTTAGRNTTRQRELRGNQDLWLLYLFFKGVSFAWYSSFHTNHLL
jgi:hypothetical protein